MNSTNFDLAQGLVSARYIKQAADARRRREGLLTTLLSQRRMPRDGWDDDTIQIVLRDISAMDSNNFVDNVGVGEREGRIYSRLVRDRYFSLSHGVGRSGDLTAEQPKAAGSSLLSKLTHLMALHALRIAGLTTASSCVILPLATGMSIAVSLLALKNRRPAATKVQEQTFAQYPFISALIFFESNCTFLPPILMLSSVARRFCGRASTRRPASRPLWPSA